MESLWQYFIALSSSGNDRSFTFFKEAIIALGGSVNASKSFLPKVLTQLGKPVDWSNVIMLQFSQTQYFLSLRNLAVLAKILVFSCLF
jgi:hypothetical protein